MVAKNTKRHFNSGELGLHLGPRICWTDILRAYPQYKAWYIYLGTQEPPHSLICFWDFPTPALGRVELDGADRWWGCTPRLCHVGDSTHHSLSWLCLCIVCVPSDYSVWTCGFLLTLQPSPRVISCLLLLRDSYLNPCHHAIEIACVLVVLAGSSGMKKQLWAVLRKGDTG